MRPAQLGFLLFFATAAQPALHGAVCAPDLLFNYINLGASGCQIGPYSVVDFTYSLIASSVTIASTDITVTPVFPAGGFGLTFSSDKFNISGSDFARYQLGYTWDPGPIRSLGDVLDSDPPVNPGTVTITTEGCKNSAFPCLPADSVKVTVFDFGTSNHLFDSVGFLPPLTPGVLGIQNVIDLEANGASSEFTSFTNQVNTPEPSTFGAGLLILACALRGVRRRD